MALTKSAFVLRLQEAIFDGEDVSLDLFPEAEILQHADELARSVLFGDMVELLLSGWHDLDDPTEAIAALCLGVKQNSHRDAFVHAIDAICEADFDNIRPFAMALDARGSNEDSSPLIRVEAVAGLVRLALRDSQWTTFAATGLLRLIDVEDEWVKGKLCRLAAVLSDQLAWDDAFDHLSVLANFEASAVEANQELGFLEMSAAFRSQDSAAMVSHLLQSAHRFRESERRAEDAPRPRMYARVAETLASALLGVGKPVELDLQALKADAATVVLYQSPRPGAEWLFPPREAELEWIPLLSHLSEGQQTGEFDPLVFFSDVVQLFTKVRAVQAVSNGVIEYRAPGRLSLLTSNAQTVGCLRQWLNGGNDVAIPPDSRAELRKRLGLSGSPSGKF